MKKRFEKLTQAHQAGTNGEELYHRPSQLARIAFKLGQGRARDIDYSEAALDAYNETRLSRTLEVAQGPNRAALQVITATALLPENRGIRRTPTWGREIKYRDGTKVHEWVSVLVAGEDKNPTNIPKTPVDGLGVIKLQGAAWPKGIDVTVDQLRIVSTAPILEDGTTGPLSTRLDVLTHSRDFLHPPDRAKIPNNTGSFSIDINAMGDVVDIGVGQDFGRTPVHAQGMDIGLASFLAGVKEFVDLTATSASSHPVA